MKCINSILSAVFIAAISLTSTAQDISKDLKIGEQGYNEVVNTMGLYEFEALDTFLVQLGNRLVEQIDQPLFEYEFYLVDSPEPNAFALPGGKVFVTRGLLVLPLSEDELAGVIGHEIIHAQNRHSIKQQRKGILGAIVALPGAIIGGLFRGPVGQAVATPFLAGGELINAQYSQGHEKEADEEGIKLAAQAGYNPHELASFLARLSAEAELLTGQAEEKSYFSSHPYTPKRVKNIGKTADKLTPSSNDHLIKQEQFLALFNGLMISQNPQYGFVDEGTLYCPERKLQIDVPDGWITATTPGSLGLASEEGDAMLSFLFDEDSLRAREFIGATEKEMAQYANMPPSRKDDFVWYGHEGSMIEYESTVQERNVKLQIYAVDLDDETVLKIASMFVVEKEQLIVDALKTAKPEKPADMPAAQIKVLRTIHAEKGQTLQAAAEEMGATEMMPALILINELPAGHVYEEGEWIKLIENQKLRFQ
jgi:predicted Zn-dependent protease